jgi:competence protein ComEA
MRRSVRRFHAVCGSGALAALLILSAPAVVAAGATEPRPASSPKGSAVDVNRATAAELLAVPGIGKSLAQRIVDFREKNGPFGKVDDLLKVQGVGEKSLERIRPYVTVGKSN